jgi:hypothetical protein
MTVTIVEEVKCLGGGRGACIVGEDGAEGRYGEGGTLLCGGCSAELREAVGDPGDRLRVRANGDGGWASVSLNGGGGAFTTGGIESGAGSCTSGDAVLGGATGGLYIRASNSRETSRAAAAFRARSSSGSAMA